MIFQNPLVRIRINHYLFNMEGENLLHKAMNVGYNMLIGIETPFEPNDSDEIEDMIFIPDPELNEVELVNELIEYFAEHEEYEKCVNIRNIINLNKMLSKIL